METLGTKIKEAVDALGDLIVSTVGSWLDRGQAALMDKGGELFGGLSASISNGIGSAKASFRDMVSPNISGPSLPSDPTPAIEKTPTRAPESTPSHEIAGMLQEAGFSMDSVSGMAVESSDLGAGASVGHDGVGCSAHDVPRAMATQIQMLQR